MIAQLHGEVIEKNMQSLVVNVQGVGYLVSVADDRLYMVNQQIILYTYYHWSQENGPQLYGFGDSLSKTVFSLILTCNGCGPKIGLAVLLHMSASEFLRTVSSQNARALSEVHGIGAKKAELMIMQLKDKITKIAWDEAVLSSNGSLMKMKQLQEALAALRYKPAEISSTLEHLDKNEAIEQSSLDELLRKGLLFLAKRL